MSFTIVMDKIIQVLTEDIPLMNMANTLFAKAFTAANVKKVFKMRNEILLQDLPCIMITRPHSEGNAESSNEGVYEHTIRIYFGFLMNDRFKAQDALITLDELIENAMMRDTSLGGIVDFVSPSSMDNDEGMNHPVYFGVKEFRITRGTTWL